MNFKGYFIRKSGVAFPNAFIAEGGYSVTPCRRTDKNSYVDGRGNLNRTILPVKRSTMQIKIMDGLTDDEVTQIQWFFPNRDYTTLEYWNKELNAYKTATFYVPDITYTVDYINESGVPIYLGLDLEFIAYGGDS